MNDRPPYRRSLALGILLLLLGTPLLAGEKAMTRQEEDEILAKARILSQAFSIIAKRVRPAVVNITVERAMATGSDPMDLWGEMLRRRFPRLQKRSVGQGSGVIVDRAGYILTNHHVVGNADSITVRLFDGRELPGELVGSDPDSDIAVLRVDSKQITHAAMGDSDDCRVGEMVLAIGSPFGLESSISSGIISARGRSGVNIVEYEDFIQTDTAINPGNSGGPLVNLKGQVIGINTAIFSKSGGYQGIGFSIPINIARTIMNAIISTKSVTSSYLGVRLQPITAKLAKAFGLESPRGALVIQVMRATPAARSGLKRGDVILRYGKRVIKDDQHMRNLVATTAPGEVVPVLIVRAGKTQTLTVRVEAVPEEIQIARKSQRMLEDIGIEVVELTEAVRNRIGYEREAWGVLVSGVRRGSTAEKIRLRPGSLILKVNGQEVKTPSELKVAVAKADAQKGLDLIWRWGRFFRRVRLNFAE